jgi:hypothetical protein
MLILRLENALVYHPLSRQSDNVPFSKVEMSP